MCNVKMPCKIYFVYEIEFLDFVFLFGIVNWMQFNDIDKIGMSRANFGLICAHSSCQQIVLDNQNIFLLSTFGVQI
jgi:hypothetical protein